MKRTTLLLVLSMMLALSGCGKKEEAHTDEHGDEPHVDAPTKVATEPGHDEPGHTEDIVLSAEAAKIAGIEVQTAREMMIQGELKVPGTVTSTSQGKAVVTPPAAGQILKLFVRVGQEVKVGQAIASLRSSDLAEAAVRIIGAEQIMVSARAKVKEAGAELDLAKGRLRSAEQTLRRQRAFAKTGAFSQPALQAAQKELADAEADLERGKQDQAVHAAQLERAERLFTQDLISRTDLELARLEVATDTIRQRNAERRIELSKATYEREKQVAEQGLANSREIQSAEAEVRAANLEVQRAKINVSTSQAGILGAGKGIQSARVGYKALAGNGTASGGTLTILAPISGVVVDLEATLGQAVERTTEICEIENLKSVWVVANVSDKQVSLARVGGSAHIKVSAFPTREFSGVVQSVGMRLDPKTRTMPVQVLVDNRDGALRSGMFGTVGLGVGANSMTLAVPRSAIVDDGDVRKLYVAEDGGKYEERVVALGRVQGEFVEVVSGLEAGARVVTKGAFVLKSEKVKGDLKGHDH